MSTVGGSGGRPLRLGLWPAGGRLSGTPVEGPSPEGGRGAVCSVGSALCGQARVPQMSRSWAGQRLIDLNTLTVHLNEFCVLGMIFYTSE